jgi:hypothetical protein
MIQMSGVVDFSLCGFILAWTKGHRLKPAPPLFLRGNFGAFLPRFREADCDGLLSACDFPAFSVPAGAKRPVLFAAHGAPHAFSSGPAVSRHLALLGQKYFQGIRL